MPFQELFMRMHRGSILSAAERDSLFALPDAKDDLIRHHTFNATDLSIIIRQHRGPANRLGNADLFNPFGLSLSKPLLTC